MPHARHLEGPKNDGGVQPPSPPLKELWLDGSSVVVSTRVAEASGGGEVWRGGAKEVAGTMRGCPSSLPPTAGGGAFGSILRLTFSFFFGVFFLSLFLFFKFYVISGWRGGQRWRWVFQTLFASTRRFNLLKSSPVDDDDIIIRTSLSAAVYFFLPLCLSLSRTLSLSKLIILRIQHVITLYTVVVPDHIRERSQQRSKNNRLIARHGNLPCWHSRELLLIIIDR